jgi:carboxymethylenebutenolidase
MLNIVTRTVAVTTSDGSRISAFVAEPERQGRYPVIVFGQEAMGFNAFGRDIAERLAAEGFFTVTPDYYRGTGPTRPDDYTDFSEVFAAIGALDFRQATYDLMVAADWARSQSNVDPERVFIWGYCTGGTLAMMAACLDRRLAGAVMYFPSQPRFETLDARHPAHPVDMVWNAACPLLILYGDQDPLMPPELLADLRARLEQWNIQHDIRIYPGASHAFTAPAPHMHHAGATAAADAAALAFIRDPKGA